MGLVHEHVPRPTSSLAPSSSVAVWPPSRLPPGHASKIIPFTPSPGAIASYLVREGNERNPSGLLRVLPANPSRSADNVP